MMHLEQLIRRFEQIETHLQLEAVLQQVAKSKPYAWCCLIVQNTLRFQLGVIPAKFSQLVANLDLRQFTREQYKPLWQCKTGHSALPESTIYIPIKTQGGQCACLLLGVGHDIATELLEKLCWYWQILATYVYDSFHRCAPISPSCQHLTKRELECLHWVAHGKTSWETAQILGIVERTVNFHINNSIAKTGCANRHQLSVIYLNYI